MHYKSVSILKILQTIARPSRCCYWDLQASSRNTLPHASKIFNLTGIHKTFAASAVVKDNSDNQTAGNYQDKPVTKENVNRLIYTFKAKTFLRISNFLFYGTACFGLYIAPDILLGTLEHTAFNFESFSNVAGIIMSTVIIPLSSRMFTKRIVLKLYHNAAKDTYVAHVFSPLLFEKKLYFHQNDVTVDEKSMIFNLTTARANNYPMFMQSYSFALPSDFNHLMGYDK